MASLNRIRISNSVLQIRVSASEYRFVRNMHKYAQNLEETILIEGTIFTSKKIFFYVFTWCWGPPCSPHCRWARRAGPGYCSWREHSVPTAEEERPDWAAAGAERPDWATAESRRQPRDNRRGMVRRRAGIEEDPRLRHQGTQLLVKYI